MSWVRIGALVKSSAPAQMKRETRNVVKVWKGTKFSEPGSAARRKNAATPKMIELETCSAETDVNVALMMDIVILEFVHLQIRLTIAA